MRYKWKLQKVDVFHRKSEEKNMVRQGSQPSAHTKSTDTTMSRRTSTEVLPLILEVIFLLVSPDPLAFPFLEHCIETLYIQVYIAEEQCPIV